MKIMHPVRTGIDMAANLSVRVNIPVEHDSSSNDILDTKPSRKYLITLEQARNRALQAIRKARSTK